MDISKKKEKRMFIYEPYGDNGATVLLYFHKKPTNPGNFNDTWDMTGVDVPTKECPEWNFWRNIQNETIGNDDIPHDLSKSEIREIKQYIREHRELVPNMFEYKEEISVSTVERVKEYFDTINLNRYDLGGCEISEEDLETIAERVNAGEGTIEQVTDDYLYKVREILDEGLEDSKELIE